MAIDATDPFEVHEVRELTGHKTKVSGKEGCGTCVHAKVLLGHAQISSSSAGILRRLEQQRQASGIRWTPCMKAAC